MTRGVTGVSALALAMGGAARAECAARVTSAEIAQRVSAGEAAFADMDEAGFQEARAVVVQALPCAADSLNASQVEAIHRMQALGAFLGRDHAGAVASFRALLASSRDYELPESLAPADHPLRLYFEVAAGMVSAPSSALPVPRKGMVRIDGKNVLSAPADRPYFFQYLDETGAVVVSALVPSGMQPPDYPSMPPDKGSRPSGVRVPLLVVAGVAGLASGGLYLAAEQKESAFWDPSTPDSDLSDLRTGVNTLGWASAGLGVVAVGTGAAAVFTGTW